MILRILGIRTTHKRLHLRDDLVQLALRLLVLLDGLLQVCQRGESRSSILARRASPATSGDAKQRAFVCARASVAEDMPGRPEQMYTE